jgi:hypothetical protein
MIIKNGRRARFIIDGVFDGMAGVQGNQVAFAPNRAGGSALAAKGALLDGEPVLISVTKDDGGPFFTAQFRSFE